MKQLALYVLLLLSFVLPTAVAEGLAAAAPDYMLIGNETVSLLNNLTDVLETVKDRDSADAAVCRVQAISAKMQELRTRAESLPSPDSIAKEELRETVNNKEVRVAVRRFMVAMLNLAQTDAYGSEELINALSRMVGGQL